MAYQVTLHDELVPGTDCPSCGRRIPEAKSDDAPATAKRERVSFSVPKGEEGVIEELEILVVEKYQDQWPEDRAAMRDGVGLKVVGSSGWRWRVHHFSLYATLMVPELAPVDEGR